MIQQKREDTDQLLMQISEDDLTQYSILKRLSTRDFLNKFDIFVTRIERDRKRK